MDTFRILMIGIFILSAILYLVEKAIRGGHLSNINFDRLVKWVVLSLLFILTVVFLLEYTATNI